MIESETLLVRLAEDMRSNFYGTYRGIVEKVGDGADLGYIRVKIPEVYGEELSPWATPCVPFAGAKHGFVMLPEKGGGVWVCFEAGCVSKPVWTGFWWGKDELPEPGGTETRALITTKGHKLVLDDDGGEIKLEHADGPGLTITGSEITLKVGGKKIVISDSAVKINGSNLEVT